MLGETARVPDESGCLLLNHVAPALQRIQGQRRSQCRIEKFVQYGTPPTDPAVSLVIPLYGRFDFLEHQMAQFVHDPQLHQADIVYVLDSPELAPQLFAFATRLEPLYRVPFRVAALKSNVGFSGATNAGASLARGACSCCSTRTYFPIAPAG